MGLLEVLLIIAGIAICVISFRIPSNKEEQFEETKELAKKEIKQLVNQELTHVKEQIDGAVDETITYAVEKTERFMDRMSNEKIMAINEYSDTVMEDIHKNHTEVLFLYDMLNDKHENIKSTAVEVDMAVKAASKEVSELKETINAVPEPKVIEIVKETVKEVAKDEIKFEPLETSQKQEPQEKVSEAIATTATPDVEISFATLGMENSNEEILRLHKEGKSNVAIAKELGLGVGEVKLVIDLFEGM